MKLCRLLVLRVSQNKEVIVCHFKMEALSDSNIWPSVIRSKI